MRPCRRKRRKLIGHLARADGAGRVAQEARQQWAQVFVGKASGQQREEHERLEEGLHGGMEEGQARHPLTADDLRPRHLVESFPAHAAILAETFHVQETSVGGKAARPESGQVLQPFAQGKVGGVIDGGFGAQGAPFFVVLLDAAVLVVHMERTGSLPR